jgi:uncharacterized protein YcbX
MATVAQIYRYPVKGLSAETMPRVTLTPGQTIPFDRAWAIENGPSGFDPAQPKTLPKIVFLMLMRNERLAELATSFNEATSTLTIRKDGAVIAEGRLDNAEGRRDLEAFFRTFSADDLRGEPKVLEAPGHSFSDTAANVVSLINLETVRAIGERIGAEVHPLRFRGNLYVEGLPAWSEFDWVGNAVKIGAIEFTATKRIERCAATNVNPVTAARDMAIPKSLMQAWGHADCGVYLKVEAGGTLSVGDTVGNRAATIVAQSPV